MKASAITLEVLVAIDTIIEHGSYAAAAKQLDKVPSALSYLIQKLEEQLNVVIFERQGRKAVLTPAGEHLIKEGRHILNAVNKLCTQTQSIADGWEASLSIAIDPLIETQQSLACLARFFTQHPDIEVTLKETVPRDTWQALLENRVDLIIGASDPIPKCKGLGVKKISTVELVYVVHCQHPLTQMRQPLNIQALTPYRRIVVNSQAQMSLPQKDDIFEQGTYFYVPSMAYQISAIEAGLGGGYVPKYLVKTQLANKTLAMITLDHQPENMGIYMAWQLKNKGRGCLALRDLVEQAYNADELE